MTEAKVIVCVSIGWLASYLVAYSFGMTVAALLCTLVIVILTVTGILLMLEGERQSVEHPRKPDHVDTCLACQERIYGL